MNTIQTTSATATPGKVTAKNKLSRAGMLVAIGAVLFWAVFAAIMLYNAGTKEADKWAHLTFVFASVQGIASAAAGALFGTAVQQDRVKNAETRASVAENAANNGRALALILQNEAAPATAGAEAFDSTGPGQPPPGDDVRQRHAALARSLFGDLLKDAVVGQPTANPTT